MASISAIVPASVQEIRAQALATLFAALEAIERIQAISGVRPNGGGAPQPALPVPVSVVAPPLNGRIALLIDGTTIEVPISAQIEAEAAANPALFQRGAALALVPDPASRSIRIVLPDALPGPTPATLVSLRASAPGPSVDPVPLLQQAFAQGTTGAALQRLTGLAFPVAERGQGISLSLAPVAAAQMPRAAIPALAVLPSELADAALKAAARQSGIAPAIAALLEGAASWHAASTVPTGAVSAIAGLAAARLDALAKPDAKSLEQALNNSGLYLEASLARGQGASSDIKALLLALRGAFGGAEPANPTPREPGAQGRPAATGRADAAPVDLARLVEGAIERIKLNQFASLPEHAGLRVTDDRAQGFQISTTIPLALEGPDRPQTAGIGLMIEHRPEDVATPPLEADEDSGEALDGAPWKVRIALDLEETGPVQAEIALRGQAVAITLWAERRATAALARHDIGRLHDALTGAAFEVTRLEVKDGRPIGRAPTHIPVVDRRT